MTNLFKWLSAHKFVVHTLAFLMMVLPSGALYLVAQRGGEAWVWVLLAPVALANILVLLVR